jgi:hypothetical protein
MATKYYLDWKEVEEEWIGTDYIWIDVAILIEDTVGEILGGDYTLALDEMDPWESMKKKLKDKRIEEEKIDALLEVIVSVKGEEKKLSKKKDTSTKILIKDIQKTLDKYSKNKVYVKAEIKGR